MTRTTAAATVLLLMGSLVAMAAPAEAASATKAAKFKNCAALHKTYAGGVAKSSKVQNTYTSRGVKKRASSTYRPKVSAALYQANRHLDRDKDGIACER